MVREILEKIVGRITEQLELKEIFDSQKAEFVAIYGRRRVGKTYLIHNFFKNKKCIYFHAVGLQHGSKEEQLENFTTSLSECFFKKEPIKNATRWKEAFERLTNAIQNDSKDKTKTVLFLDELPWMATPKSGLLEALDYYWNKYWSHMPNLKLIICGSAASWIIRKIIYNQGGLHNRVTKQIILNPFSLYETKHYLINMGCNYNEDQILELYMVLGGIPHYLNAISKRLSSMQNINKLCFNKDEILFNEFDKLFLSLFKHPDPYIEIIRVIATSKSGIARNQLEKKCKLTKKGGTLSDRLKVLEDTGFIISFMPVITDTRELFYKVIDEYSLFYLQWIEPEKKSLLKLEKGNKFWQSKYKTAAWYCWAGYAFESICYKHLHIIRRSLNIPDGSRASAWLYATKNLDEQGAQIDLLFDRPDKAFTICEIKYSEQLYSIDKQYAKNLRLKEEVFVKMTKTQKQIFLAMVAAHGVKENIYAEDLSGVVTMKDLFAK